MPGRSDIRTWHWRLLAVTIAVLVPAAVFAQHLPASPPVPSAAPRPSASWPGPEDMERALKARPLPTPERLATQPLREVPRTEAGTTHAPSTGTLDIAAMARQGALLNAPPGAATLASPLRIFITLEMPRGSLQRLVDQANRAGATLVLRGLKSQSMRQTAAAVAAMIESRTVSWVIDPDAFTRFRVAAAPTFVLTLADESSDGAPATQTPDELPRCGGSGCATPASPATFLSVSGDVSLDYALQAMLRHSPEAAQRANALLQKLRKS